MDYILKICILCTCPINPSKLIFLRVVADSGFWWLYATPLGCFWPGI